MYSEANHGEFLEMPNVKLIANLSFGEGIIGRDNQLTTTEAQEQFAIDLAYCTKPVTDQFTADCVDERRTIGLGDGTTDPHILENRVVPQLPGGLGLAVAKAGVAADLAFLRDTKTFQQAYETVSVLLTELGYRDGGHIDCGASKKVELSVAQEVPQEIMLATLPAMNTTTPETPAMLAYNWQTKRQRLEGGFYSKWDNRWHEDYLSNRAPQQFSRLEEDSNSPTNGHNAQAVYAIKRPGMGFAKNLFIARTGKAAFADTTYSPEAIVRDIANKIGGSQTERARFLLEFDVDAPQVLNQLVAKGFPVFAQAA